MINLIKNEYKKIGYIKIILSLIFICLISLIILLSINNNISDTLLNLIPLIEIIISVLFSGIFSNEIINGTFRVYLTKSVSRNKIFLSKCLAILIYEVIIILIVILLYIIYLNKIDIKFIKDIFFYSIPMILINQIILIMSNITNSTSLTLGLTTIFIIFSSTISNLLLYLNFNIIKYTFLPYVDLLYLYNNNYYNLSINNGIFIIIISSIIIYFTNNYLFNKKDIKC